MIIRIFSSGKSNGQSPVNYLLNDKNHTGEARSQKPEVLEGGNPNTTIEIINSIGREWKYVSGVIAFRNEEKPSREEMLNVIDKFKQTFCAGLNNNQFNSLFVLHKEANDEIHFVVPMVELTTGKRLNIHPPGQHNLDLYSAFVSVMSHELGFSQVIPNGLKIALPSHKLKSPEFKEDQRKNILLEKQIKQAIVSGKVENRNQLCKWLDEELGVSVNRQGKDYISIRLPADKKNRRLKGPMFEENANYREMLKTSRQSKSFVKLTDSQYHEQKIKLNELTNQRASFNQLAYSKAKPVRLGGNKQSFINAKKTVVPKTTINKEITPMANYTVMKRIIRQALLKMLIGEPTKKPKITVPNIKQVLKQRQEIREKAYPSRNNNAGNNGAILSLIKTIGQVKMSIQEAMADLANARDPKEKMIAEQRLRELLELERQLGEQLNQANANLGLQQNKL